MPLPVRRTMLAVRSCLESQRMTEAAQKSLNTTVKQQVSLGVVEAVLLRVRAAGRALRHQLQLVESAVISHGLLYPNASIEVSKRASKAARLLEAHVRDFTPARPSAVGRSVFISKSKNCAEPG